MAEFIAKFPQADIQQLRTLIRNAQREAAAEKPPKSSRELFKLIREVSETSESGQTDETNELNETDESEPPI